MAGWHHPLNVRGSEQTLGDSGGQRSLAGCSSRGHKQSDMTLRLNNNKARPWAGVETSGSRLPPLQKESIRRSSPSCLKGLVLMHSHQIMIHITGEHTAQAGRAPIQWKI